MQVCCSHFPCGVLPYEESTVTNPARFAVRLNAADMARITRAATLHGMPLSAFVRDAALREADVAIAAELAVTLSAEESRRFLSALDNPFKPNVRLKKAMVRAAKLVPRR